MGLSRLGFLVLATGVITASAVYLVSTDEPDFSKPARLITDERLRNPADIIKFKGRYVATQIYDQRLAIFDDLTLHGFQYFDPGDVDKQFSSPHFLAIAPDGGLLISNGWGDSIVEIGDLTGRRWREFTGIGKRFRAPHGICVDPDGWIYVGDSLNSRLVRFRDMEGRDWQVFRDHDKRISYIRELVCRDGAVLVSNSYENRPGLNPGRGGNILEITDFASGRVEVVFEIPDTNITGLLPLDDNRLVAGLWGARRRLALLDTTRVARTEFPPQALGTPYGMYHDSAANEVLVTHIGSLSDAPDRNPGGIAVYR